MTLYEQIVNREENIAVIGLGYVGLPLALSFAKKANVIAFDIDEEKINQYKDAIDINGQVKEEEFKDVSIIFTSDERELRNAKFHIITVQTPIYENNIPNLEYIKEASKIVARNLNKNSIIVYESTVYPGVTEEFCIPILENYSGLKCGIDFKVGYSPERINPSDPVNRLESIVKIVSGMDKESLDIIAKVYELIITGGVHRAESIKVAEAAKLIENVQRDINIALMNEISIILGELNIDTKSVLQATATKWNAINFKPGLVGGHCIGVDTHYLSYIAKKYGLNPELILTGRKINDYMPKYISEEIIRRLSEGGDSIEGANIAIFGFAFKENCSDTRNTKVIDIINYLKGHGINVKVVDPYVDPEEVLDEYGIKIYDTDEIRNMDGIIFAVAHDQFLRYSLEDLKYMYLQNMPSLLIDIKAIFDKEDALSLGYDYWSL